MKRKADDTVANVRALQNRVRALQREISQTRNLQKQLALHQEMRRLLYFLNKRL